MNKHCRCCTPTTEPGHGQRGFTLIEMLVTLVLMAMLSVLGWRALDTTERSSIALQERANDTLVLVRTLDQLESDISAHAYFDGGLAVAAGRSGVELATTLPASLQWQHPQLSVMRMNSSGGLERVVWAQRGQTLIRQVRAVEDNAPSSAVFSSQVALTAVSGFELQVWIPGRGWMSSNDAPSGLRASGLQVQIQRLHRGVLETYRKVVLLP